MSETPRSRAIVVLGMHRSGTSAVTRLINLMGAELGSNLMAAMEGNNETGFWEHQDVVEVHEEVLAFLGRRWDDVRAMPGALAARSDLAPFRQRLADIITRDFAGVGLWAVKDPRTCRLVPIWRDILTAAAVEPAFLIVLRHPLEVARSLSRRDGFSEGKGLLLWLRHALEAERDTRGARRAFLSYGDLISDWSTALGKVGHALEISWPNSTTDITSNVASFLESGRRTFSLTDDAVLSDPALSRWVREVHAAFLELQARDVEEPRRRLDSIAEQMETAGSLYDPVVESTAPLIDELYRRVHGLEQSLAERDTRITERDSRIAEREARLDAQRTALSELRHGHRQLSSRLERRDHDVAALNGMLAQAEIARQEIFRSTSWRLAAPLRVVGRLARGLFRFLRYPATYLRYRRHPVSLAPWQNVEAVGSDFRFTGPVGHFRLETTAGSIPACRAIVSYRLISNSRTLLQTWLYAGDRPTYDEGSAVRLPLAQGDVTTVVDLPANLSALRIEPVGPASSFQMSDLRIIEVGSLILAWHWLRLWLGQALFDSRKRHELIAKTRYALSQSGGLAAIFNRMTRPAHAHSYQDWIEAYDTLTEADRSAIATRISAMEPAPLFSIVMPTYNSPERWIRRAIDSVREQLYPHWELCIADDASTAPHVRALLDDYARRDSRIKVTFRAENGHISQASNSALSLASGQYVVLLDHDDELPSHALYMVAEEVVAHPDADIVFSDEDKIDEEGRRFDPYFKSEYNPDLMLSHNMVSHLGVYRRALVEQVGKFRIGYEGSQDYDLALRCIDACGIARVRHIPFILYHWRAIVGSVALAGDQKTYAHGIARKAIKAHLERTSHPDATVVPTFNGNVHRVVYPLPDPPPRVSVIIPTRDKLDLLVQCIESVIAKTDYSNLELIIVDHMSCEPATLKYLAALAASGRARVLSYQGEYNFSDINNQAANSATGDVLCFLNNDVEAINAEWLRVMVELTTRADVGAVGAKLYYPDGTIQHGGIVLAPAYTAWHAHKGLPRGQPGYFGRAILQQSFSAVTAACMVVRRDVFEAVGGFDSKNLAIAYNDVDLCLRLAERGYRTVWTPYAELYHHESATLGEPEAAPRKSQFESERLIFCQRWGRIIAADPCYSPNLAQARTDFALAFPPRVVKPWKQAATG